MEFRILGPIEALDRGRLLPMPRGRVRALLAILILRAGEVVSTDRLINELWGDTPPPTVGTALQGLVSKLRKCLEPSRAKDVAPTFIVTRSPGYLLAIDPGRIDANQFRRLVAQVGELENEEATKVLRQALSLWRGPALADVMYEPFAQAEIAALEELRLTAIERRIGADLALGLDTELVGELEGLVVENPTRERLCEHLMLALYRSGRQAEALEVYADTRRTLVEELGLDPGSSLQRLENMILRQDPALDLSPVPARSGQPTEPSVLAPSASHQWISEERRTVTVVVVDIEALTDSDEPPDTEIAQRVVARFLDKAVKVVTGHGGSLEEVIGDRLVSAFGVPTAREDDALRAVRAAVDLRHLLSAFNRELSHEHEPRIAARIGIDTGEVVVSEASTATAISSGVTFRRAARLQQMAATGEILVGEATRLLVRKSALLEPAESHAPDVHERPFLAWRLVDLVPDAPALPRHLNVPMIGRESELARLRAAYERTVQERNAQRFTVLGEAGIGKTRLARELAASVGREARVFTGHCPTYGSGITFWPLRQIALAAAGGSSREALLALLGAEDDAESIVDHLAGAIGSAGPADDPGSLFPMLSRFFEGLARHGPVAVILDDLHWAQPTFLDLVEYLTETTTAPVFFLCLARPELLERRAGWAEGSGDFVVLEPLGPEESQRLVANRLAGRMVPGEALARIVETAQGNPLFAEQMVAAVGEEGGAHSIPATLQALLASRLDRLGPAERDLIRSASVLGTHFSVAALKALLPNDAHRTTARHLQVLERKNFILPTPGPQPEEEFSFGHVLIQQAAYLSMTKATRAELHERAVEWLDTDAGQDTKEFEETTGYHLEKAFGYRRELGVLDDHDRELAVRAGEKLANAGMRAFARFDAAAAENLLSRAKALLPSGHSQRWGVERELAGAYQVMGRHSEAETTLAELLENLAREEPDALLEHSLRLEQVRVRLAIGPDPIRLDAIRKDVAEAQTVYEVVADESGLAQVCFLLGEISLRLGQLTDMEHIARLGLSHADRSPSSREQLGAQRMLATALEAGPTPVEKSILECEELVLWRGSENPGVQPILAHLRSMLGEFDVARSLLERARRLLSQRYRARRPVLLLKKRSAQVAILAGDLPGAESELRDALEHSLDMGTQETSEIAALLSRVLTMQGDPTKAAEMAETSERHAPSESVSAQALWRVALAQAEVARGNPHEGERLVRESIGLVPAEMLNLSADLRVVLAQVLASGEQRKRASAAIQDAISLYELKGNVVGAREARSVGGFMAEPMASG